MIDAEAWAQQLGISRAAVDLYLASEVVDLHLDSFIWRRLFGYDLAREHGSGWLNGWFYSQSDIPRLRAAGVGGAVWVITTNPLRSLRGRRDTLLDNVVRLRTELEAAGIAIAGDATAYAAIRARGQHAALLGIQGGNALEYDLADFDRPELAALSLVTLMHFTRSRIGTPALPYPRGDQHLTRFGADYVRKLNERRVMVDLAHISHEGFQDVLALHDRTQPLTISHAACDAVFPHFRNVTDDELRAVANTGGVIGVIFNTAFLGGSLFNGRAERVIDHVQHMLKVVGSRHVALGSDFDGAIIGPRDLRTIRELPRLVELMLRRGIPELDIQNVLGKSFLRAFAALRS
ncbi:MAG TPA: membrane dipeptidase [Polyangiales bacterium]|nr:membrane dipeptidase [Polyangiales bacterium]